LNLGAHSVRLEAAPPCFPTRLRRDDFVREGVYVTLSDAEQGHVWSLPLAPGSVAVLREVRAALAALPPKARDARFLPHVSYHGTDGRHAVSIAARGLQPSNGMMGEARCTGSLWKAARYAAYTQDWETRPAPVLIRILAWPRRLVTKRLGPPCGCARCARPRDAFERASARVADHLGLWSHDGADGIEVPPLTVEVDGASIVVTRNTEYAWAPHTALVVDGCMSVDVAALLRPDGKRDPTARRPCVR
jgi:hypothetical protein